MKILFCSFIFSVFSVIQCFSQSHMEFKGIQMDGSLTNFIEHMEKQGFKYIDYKSSPRYAIMKGRFLEYICEIAISATPVSGKVYMITATTEPFDKSWEALDMNIDYSIRILEQKFGKYEGDYKFMEPYYKGCGEELKAIKEEKLLTDLFFCGTKGEVILTVNSNCSIYYTYYDYQNRKLADIEYEQEANIMCAN